MISSRASVITQTMVDLLAGVTGTPGCNGSAGRIDHQWWTVGHLGEGGHIRSGSGIGGLRVTPTLVGFLANRPRGVPVLGMLLRLLAGAQITEGAHPQGHRAAR